MPVRSTFIAASNVGYPGKTKTLFVAGKMDTSVATGNPRVNPKGIIALVVAAWLNISIPMIKIAIANVHGWFVVMPLRAPFIAASLCAMNVLLIHTTPNTLIIADAIELNKLAFTT